MSCVSGEAETLRSPRGMLADMATQRGFCLVFALFLSAWTIAPASAQCLFPFTPTNVAYDYKSSAFQALFSQLNSTVDEFVQQTGVPSYAVAVVHENQVIYRSGLTTTPFRCASITKTFTALAPFLLRERGLLSLDDPINKFLPDFSIISPYGEHNTTLRELMAHVSGLPMQLCPFFHTCTNDETEILKQISGMELVRPPWSSDPIYSNIGFALLGHTWEKATSPQVSWWDFIRDNIVKPLGMVNTGVDISTVGLALATNSDPWSKQDLGWSAPAAQMYSTAEDLAKYLVFLINGNPSLISDASRREWIRPTKLFADGSGGYAMPWELRKLAKNVSTEFLVTKSGNIYSYLSQIAFHQSSKLGVVVLTVYNRAFVPGPDALADSILTTLIPGVQSINDQVTSANFDGVYTCAPSPGFASPTLNGTVVTVLGGDITISSNTSRGLLATFSVNLQNNGGGPYVSGGTDLALLAKNATENSFWFGDGRRCDWFAGALSANPDLKTPNTPGSLYTNELIFDPATSSVTWPTVGANCTRSP